MTTRTGRLAEYRRKRDFRRTREPAGGKRKSPRHRDETADPDIDPTEAYPTSARTGRTMHEIAEGQRKGRV